MYELFDGVMFFERTIFFYIHQNIANIINPLDIDKIYLLIDFLVFDSLDELLRNSFNPNTILSCELT